MFQFGDRRGLLEVGEGFGVVYDVSAVEGVRGGGELFHRLLPGRGQQAGQVGVAIRVSRSCERVERGGDHQLQVAFG